MAGAKAAIEAAVAKRDEDFNFGTVVADRLRKLPDGYIKENAKIEILQVILRAEHPIPSNYNQQSFTNLLNN
jgi:hypothetical protein